MILDHRRVLMFFALVCFIGLGAVQSQAETLIGACIPTGDPDKMWDCMFKPDRYESQKVSCDKPSTDTLDERWFTLRSNAQVQEFLRNQFDTLGLKDFVQWTACQGLSTSLGTSSEVSDVEAMQGKLSPVDELTVSLLWHHDKRLQKMIDNWYFWCAEPPLSILTDMIFGCHAPFGMDFKIKFERSGKVKSIELSGTPMGK